MEFTFSTSTSSNRSRVFQRCRIVAAFVVTLLMAAVIVPSAESQNIPVGAASLAFVFDITGSMYDDLVQVIDGAAKILATALFRREKPLYNYVLVPFHDPEIGPVLVTTDHLQFQKALQDLYVQGGGDCPEMSIGAIKKALEVSLPHSFIYVFTDARSKDFYLTEEVLALIQQKQSQVVFVLTGDCGNVTHRGYRAYEEIAATSSGQVFLLKKSQVNQVLNFVRVAVQARKVNLLSLDEDLADTQILNVPIDSNLQEITVSVSGENPKIFLKDPSGNKRTTESGVKELLSIKNVQIVNVKDPTPGTWRIRVGSTSPHSIRITGLSTTDFAAGFSKYPTREFSTTTLRPIQGIPSYLLINVTDVNYPAKLDTLQLINLKGDSIAKYPLTQDPAIPSLYNVTSFIPPDQFFYIKVQGVDEKGYTLQRTSPTAISPLLPKPPSIYMRAITRGFYDQTAVLTCQVQSLVPYSVQWFRDGKQQGFDVFLSDSANVTLEIPRASTYSEGEYICNATNTAGSASTQTFLDISDPPPIIVPPQNVSSLPGETAVLTCVAFSTVQFNMTWRRIGSPGNQRLDSRMRSYNNGSLVIHKVQPQDEGTYQCQANNEGGSTIETVSLRLQVRPLAQVFPAEHTFTTGSTRNFSCHGGGYPTPRFHWQRSSRVIIPSHRIAVRDGELSIMDLRREDEGRYDCVATNSAGEDYSVGRLVYIEAPRVREYERKVLVAAGGHARLSCKADGIPPPNITWYRSDRRLQSAYNVEVSRTGQLVIEKVQNLDAGQYRCVATNEAGSDFATMALEVGSPPEITERPSNIGIEIESNGSLPCSAVGMPPPKITWRRGDGRQLTPSGRFRQQTTGSLDISTITLEDEGMYTCVAQNPYGKSEASAFVSVTGIVRPLIAYTFPFVKVIAGETAELECVVLLGKPSPTLSWLRQGQLLRSSSRVRFSSPGRIVIQNVQEADDGEYVCMASNIGGNETYTISLDVLVPPKFDQSSELDQKRNFSVVQGRGVVLPCNVEGDPPPSFAWFKDGSPISLVDVHYFVRQDGSLEIFSADTRDTGQYKCVASNIAGEVEKDMNLFVQVGPEIVGPEEETFEVNEGQSILLPCEVSGNPRPMVQWRQNFRPFNPRSARFQFQETGLYLQGAQVADKAIYECIVSNIAGNTSKVITLIVYIPPSILPSLSEVVVLEGQPATLECEAQGDPQPVVSWRKNAVSLDTSDADHGYSLQRPGVLGIEAAHLNDAGKYTCTATNPAGKISQDIQLIVHAPPSLPPSLPEYTEVVENNPVILPCPAQGTPRPRIVWTKNGVPLTGNELGIEFLEDGSLEIESALAADSGAYKCLAHNVAGNVSHAVDLKILVPPKLTGPDGTFTYDPNNPKVVIDRTVTLTCPVSPDTDPAPVLTWFKDDQLLQQKDLMGRLFVTDNGLSLTITKAQLGDEARYRCVASNVAGEVQKVFNLEVQVPPGVDSNSSSPLNQTVIQGQPLYINCPISGKPSPRVLWLKDGEPLSADLDPNIRILAEGRRLEILRSKVTDRGRYTCVGQNVAGEISREYGLDVFVPPSIENLGQMEEAEAVVGNDLRIICPASGIPLPKITWFQRDTPIKANSSKYALENQGWTLLIKQTTVEDASRYFCRAENVAGESEKTFNVEILVPPKINKESPLRNPEVVVNTTAIINCPVSGNPQPEILWYRNGVLLDASIQPRFEILASGRQLRIYETQVKDRGQYRCTARNRAGEDSADFSLDVLVPPKIDHQGVTLNNKVIVNGTITLHCPASGIPPPLILWYKDGQELNPVEDPTVEIRNVGTELVIRRASVLDSGQYSCVATNPAGEAAENFRLNVQVPPTISSEGLNLNPRAIENSTIYLECLVQGVPEPKVMWFHNNQPLDEEKNRHIQIHNNGQRLQISQAQVSDSGTYICIATNEAGESEKTFDLQVWVSPVINEDLVDKEPRVIKGQTATFDCPVYGIPFPTVTWQKDGANISTDDPRIRILSSGIQLQIFNTMESDTGIYSCTATNPAGSDSVSLDFVVHVPPSIDESNVVYNPKTVVDRLVVLECPVSGIPPPEVQWLRNGESLLESNGHLRLLNNNRHLQIDRAQTSDTALYTCIASNDAGELERNFDLEVQVPPSIESEDVQNNLTVVQNNTITIDCPAIGVPQPSIIWFKDEAPLLDWPYRDLRVLNDDRTLEVSNAQVEDAGSYTCLANNPAGQDELHFHLEVQVPPLIHSPATDRLSVIMGDSISMKCNVTGIPTPTLLWLHNTEVLLTSQDSHVSILSNDSLLQLSKVTPADAGKYTCHAENQAGFSEKIFHLDVWVPATINGSDRLQDVPVIINKQVILSCPAQGTPHPEITWYRKGRPVSPYGAPNIRLQDNGQTLIIMSAQLLDFGDYSCQASNPAGKASLNFRLAVMVPPEINEGPTEIAASVNTQTTLMCETNGQPAPTVEWEKNGEPFPSTGLRHRMMSSGSLEFMLVRLEDDGEYTCTASNAAGNVTRTITLQVQVPAKIISSGPSTVQVPLAGSIVVPCETEGSPQPTTFWLKNRAILQETENHRVLTNGSLLISNLQLSDAGVFTCIAQNNAGTDNRDVRLVVQVPPRITASQTQFTALQNRTIVLPCQAAGRPRPTIRWMHNGQEISSTNHRTSYGRVHYITLHTGGLAIPHVRAEDEGVYRCIAENDAGESFVELSLTVQVPPTIQQSAQQVVVSVGDRTILPCVTTGNPKPTITWSYERRRIDLRDSKYTLMEDGSLVINGVQEEDTGSYVCSAQNVAGRDSHGRLLRVQVPPSFIQVPRNKEVTLNSRFDLECSARGAPTPVIQWRLNDKPIAAQPSVNGVSTLIVRHATLEDGGEYTCIATNPANNQQVTAAARVVIKVPPRVIVAPGDQAVRIAEKAIIDCSFAGDPVPDILWTKNGRPVVFSERIRQLNNGSLVIYDLLPSDAGEYKCIAVNDAGVSEAQSIITVNSEPHFLIEPKSQTVNEGQTITFDCTSEGVPTPDMYWWKERVELETKGRVTILPNNSLRIVATQLNDSGLYRCFASNRLGKTFVETMLNVVVHGRYSDWSLWGDCSASCGKGVHYRSRSCDNPPPANGGRDCMGERMESASCQLKPCPLDGHWGNWQSWTQCSTSCGAGQRQRHRLCNNPSPQVDGRPCDGDDVQEDLCNLIQCPINGNWGMWTPWGPCSQTCGRGLQQRFRECNNPRPQFDGTDCSGNDAEQRACQNQQCAVDGNWGTWLPWSSCSLSCGGGIRSRQRHCDSPEPQFDGTDCVGGHQQRDYCNSEPCPIHGNWAGWGAWGPCSLTCGGGQRKRFRTCSNPSPSINGRPCVGSAEDLDFCNVPFCPVDGRWTEWSQWTSCTKTCDGGTQERQRSCQQPQYGGRPCLGDTTEIATCNSDLCSRLPIKAEGNLIGYVNSVDIVDSKIIATITPSDTSTNVKGVIRNIPSDATNSLQHLVSLLNSVYWTTASEVDGAANGFTLTKGEFTREVQVEFATGEILKMSHYANGVDRNGVLLFDIVIRGDVPDLGPIKSLYLAPYREQYIQTGPGTIYAHSSRLLRADGLTLPYAWNHTITYEESLGRMPYLVQELQTQDMTVEILSDRETMQFSLDATISPGSPSNMCPKGFLQADDASFCRDEDECIESPCSHYCHNAPGAFACSCPGGYHLKSDARTCEDVDECKQESRCPSNQECLNTQGSYQCVVNCGSGFSRSQDGQKCEDVNECLDTPEVCEQTCQNLVGSYRCSCSLGYRLGDNGRCIDVNECDRPSSPCSHNCVNTPGSYHCACPNGFELLNGLICRDKNECFERTHRCRADQECINTQGSYECVQLCPAGFLRVASGDCQDIDECAANQHRCYSNQRCINTEGGYRCQCPQGFRSRGPGEQCVDIDECAESSSICRFRCHNTWGDYECLCPTGQLRLADRKSCAGLEFLEPGRVLPANGYEQNQAWYSKGSGNRRRYRRNSQCINGHCSKAKVNINEHCPDGMISDASQFGKCIDVDECSLRADICQHNCTNTHGSYYCTCPSGYRLGSDGYSCQDINECVEQMINCGEEQMCFNTRGSYSCIAIPCPLTYVRDPTTNYCVLECVDPNIPCPPGAKYADVIQYRTVALPGGIPARQDLIRLTAYNQNDEVLPETTFTIMENDPKLIFYIRPEDGKGIVYTLAPLGDGQTYRIMVRAQSFDSGRRNVQYQTTFIIHIAVSDFPY